MTVRRLKVTTRTPDAGTPRARGFYQMEEDTLYFPIETGQIRSRYYSFLDSEFVSLQLDRDGKLIFVEITLPRRRWQVEPNLVHPEQSVAGDIRFLDFRERFDEPEILCDDDRQTVYINFSSRPARVTYRLADNVLVQVDAHDHVTAVWLTGIIDDRAGKKISAWRKALRMNVAVSLQPAAVSQM